MYQLLSVTGTASKCLIQVNITLPYHMTGYIDDVTPRRAWVQIRTIDLELLKKNTARKYLPSDRLILLIYSVTFVPRTIITNRLTLDLSETGEQKASGWNEFSLDGAYRNTNLHTQLHRLLKIYIFLWICRVKTQPIPLAFPQSIYKYTSLVLHHSHHISYNTIKPVAAPLGSTKLRS